MKRTFKILAIAIATLGVVTTSCSSKRDDEHQAVKYNFAGNWKIYGICRFLGEAADVSKNNYYMEFSADKSYITNYLDTNVSGTYIYDGKDQITVTTTDKKKYIIKSTV